MMADIRRHATRALGAQQGRENVDGACKDLVGKANVSGVKGGPCLGPKGVARCFSHPLNNLSALQACSPGADPNQAHNVRLA